VEIVFLPEKLFNLFQLHITNEYFGSDLCFQSRRRRFFNGPHQTYIEDYSGLMIHILRNIQAALHLTYSKDVLSARAESSYYGNERRRRPFRFVNPDIYGPGRRVQSKARGSGE
jgi:hypothetical protein